MALDEISRPCRIFAAPPPGSAGGQGAPATYATFDALNGPADLTDGSFFHVDLPSGHLVDFGNVRAGDPAARVVMSFANTISEMKFDPSIGT